MASLSEMVNSVKTRPGGAGDKEVLSASWVNIKQRPCQHLFRMLLVTGGAG